MLFFVHKKMDEPSFFSVLYAKPNNLIAFETFHINLLGMVAYPIASLTRGSCPMWLNDKITDRYKYFNFIIKRKTTKTVKKLFWTFFTLDLVLKHIVLEF